MVEVCTQQYLFELFLKAGHNCFLNDVFLKEEADPKIAQSENIMDGIP